MNETMKTALTHLETCTNALRQFRATTDAGITADNGLADDCLRHSDEATKLLTRLNRMQEAIRRAALATAK